MKRLLVLSLVLLVVQLFPAGLHAAPSAPVATAATSVTQTGFSASWEEAAGATGYRLDVARDAGFTDPVSGFDNRDVAAVTSFSVSGLGAATTYYYRVRAYDGSGTSLDSNIIVLVTLPDAPAAPVATAATAVGQTGFTATWGAVGGALGYRLDLATDDTFTTFVSGFDNRDVAAATGYGVSGLTPGATYYYRVRAYNGGGTGASSNVITQTTLPATPSPPTATDATLITQTGFRAQWETVAGATGYRLDVSVGSAFTTFVTGYNNLDVSAVSGYAVSGLANGTAYYYRVRAYNEGGTSSSSNVVMLATLPAVPAAPVAKAATLVTQTGFTATWGTVTGATGYRLDVGTDSGFTSFVGGYNGLDVSSVTSHAVSGLANGTTYYYRVRAYNSGGTSQNSSTIGVATLPATPGAPVALEAASVTQTSFVAGWNAVGGATAYILDVATDAAFASLVTGYGSKNTGNVTSYTVSSLSPGTTYYYRLRATNSGGTGVNSNTVVLVTLPPSPAAPTATAATLVTQTGFTATWGTATGATGYRLDVATNSGFTSFVSGYNNLDVGNVTSRALTGLNTGVIYYYRVRAYNSGGTGTNSNVISQATLATPVAATASSITQTSFTAAWGAVTGAAGYRLDVSTSSDFGVFVSGYENRDAGAVTSVSVSGLTAAGTYYYRVRSYNDTVTSANSNTITLTTLPNPPGAPQADAATGIGATAFTAKWQAATGATGYRLDVSTVADFATTLTSFTNKSVGTVTSQAVSGLTAATTYYYRVRAVNSGGSSADSNVITLSTLPLAPVAVGGSDVSTTGFTANWGEVAGALGYRLDVSTSTAFSTYVTGFSNLDVGNVTTWSVTDLTPGTKYYYRVRAYTGGGSGANSNIITQAVLPVAPVAAVATSVTASGFKASWGAVSGATGYELDVATDASFTTFVTDFNDRNVANVTTYTVTGLAAASTYYYRVRAFTAAGSGESSNVVTLLTPPAAPVANAAGSVTMTGFTASWGRVVGASGYRLDVASNSGFSTYVTGFRDLDMGNSTSAVIGSLTSGATYYYRVRAYNDGGAGINSNAVSQATLATPVAAAATSITQGGFTANWGSVSAATGFLLDVATDSAFSTPLGGYTGRDVGNVTSLAVTGLTTSTAYYYRVRAYNSDTTSPNSATITLTTLPPNPPPPAALAATAVAKAGFTANWIKVSEATGYYLDVATDSSFSRMVTGYANRDVKNVATLAVSGLNGGVTYYYRLRAYNSGGPSYNSNTVSLTTLPASFPDPPVAAAATNVTTSGFTASWGAVSEALGYVVFVATDPAFTSLVPGYADRDVSNVTTFNVTNITPGITYYFQVRAYNTAGTSAASNTVTLATLPAAPVAAAASNASQTGFTANWSTTSGVAAGYRLDIATNPQFTTFFPTYNNRDVGSVTSLAVTGVTPGTTYYYRVRAYHGTDISANSNVISQAVLLNAPVAHAATSISPTGFSASWSVQPLATGYKIDVSTRADFLVNVVGYDNCDVENATEFYVGGLTPGTTYYFRVRAYNAVSGGTSSNVITVTPPPLLTVTVGGTGGGSVHSDSGGVACSGGTSDICSAIYDKGASVLLTATPDVSSFLKGWGGACTGSGSGACSLTMDAAKNVTVDFGRIMARIYDPLTLRLYDTIQAAYNAAAEGALIQLVGGQFSGSLVTGRGIRVTLGGGYDTSYEPGSLETVLVGTVTVSTGSVIVDSVSIR